MIYGTIGLFLYVKFYIKQYVEKDDRLLHNSIKMSKEVLVEMQKYMRNHKEYYGCFAD